MQGTTTKNTTTQTEKEIIEAIGFFPRLPPKGKRYRYVNPPKGYKHQNEFDGNDQDFNPDFDSCDHNDDAACMQIHG